MRTGLTTVLLLVVLAGCAPSPETLVREALREAELAAEQERVSDLRGLVAEQYQDDDGRTRDDLIRLAKDYVERHRPVHFLIVERRLVRTGSGPIEVELLVAAASVPLESLLDVSRASADVGVVTLSFLEESQHTWRIARADWRPASAADFLPRR